MKHLILRVQSWEKPTEISAQEQTETWKKCQFDALPSADCTTNSMLHTQITAARQGKYYSDFRIRIFPKFRGKIH